MENNMLVVLRGDREHYPELEKIGKTASLLGNAVHLLVIAYNASLDSHYWFDQEGKDKAQESYCHKLSQSLEAEVEGLKALGVEAKCEVVWSKRLHEAVADYCDKNPVDWVVKACDQHSLVERVFFTHSDWHLIREVDRPLWLIKNAEPFQNPLLAVAVDPAQAHDKPQSLDVELVQSGKALSEKLRGRFKVMHAYDPIPPTLLTDIGSTAAQEITEQVAQQHRKAFESLMEQKGILEPEQYLVEDDVHHALPEWLKQQQASLLLIGAVKRSKFNQWLLGSTAERLLESVETDILVLKPS